MAKSTTGPSAFTPLTLPHLSINPASPTTILLIHGAFSNKDTWAPLHTLFSPSKYHLLMPTLPGHQEAASTHPAKRDLTYSHTSELLSQLVMPLGRKVHVVGHSFGANVALHFISHFPELIASVFVCGTAGFNVSKFVPYALWLDGIVTYGFPMSLIEYLIDMDPPLRGGSKKSGGWRSMELCTAISEMLQVPAVDERVITASTEDKLKEDKVRVLVAAATKKGVLPTNDDLARAQLVAQRVGGVAVEVPTMRHAWHIQDPRLFAKVVIAWVEGEELPGEVVRV